MRSGRSRNVTPNGGAIWNGITLMRVSEPKPVSLARRRPRGRNSAVSWPPIDTIGTIGTFCSSASLMKPLRPAKSTLSDSQLGRNDSWSPPG